MKANEEAADDVNEAWYCANTIEKDVKERKEKFVGVIQLSISLSFSFSILRLFLSPFCRLQLLIHQRTTMSSSQ